MQENLLYVVYGLCIMFYAVMAWRFWLRCEGGVLPRLVAATMALQALECLKDYWFIGETYWIETPTWNLMSGIDFVVMPFYACILIALCKPGGTNRKGIRRHLLFAEIPFVALLFLHSTTGFSLFHYALITWAAAYGTTCFVWTFVQIPRYRRWLREQYSYRNPLLLQWLYIILFSFFIVLCLYIIDCFQLNIRLEISYMLCNIGLWIVIGNAILRIYPLINQLTATEPLDSAVPEHTLSARLTRLFAEEKLYLNPQLQLNDVARALGTNRTYMSRHFNNEQGVTFYDYVNEFRLNHATGLLQNTDDTLPDIAEQSGFNSLSTFRRQFARKFGCTPAEYRLQNRGGWNWLQQSELYALTLHF